MRNNTVGTTEITPVETEVARSKKQESRDFSCGRFKNKEITLADNLIMLRQIQELPENWNAFGAHAFKRKHIKMIRSIIRDLPVQPQIYAYADNTIWLEFTKSDPEWSDVSMYFCVHKDGACWYELETVDRRPIRYPIYRQQIKDKVNAFYWKD